MNDAVSPPPQEATIAAALLEQGRIVHAASLVLALAVVVVASRHPVGGPGVVLAVSGVLFLMAESYLAIRVGFDARLFAALGDGRLDLAALDAGLTKFGMLTPAKAGRTLAPRFEGAMRLFRFQTICAMLLGTCLLAEMAMMLLAPGLS